jgi:hypothetical protein
MQFLVESRYTLTPNDIDTDMSATTFRRIVVHTDGM